MIGRLTGVLRSVQPPWVLLDCAGVGYEVEVTLPTLSALPALGAAAVLHTHMVVRDDAHLLFGFHSTAERDLFRALIKVNGVGPKMGLALLSSLSQDELAGAIEGKDVSRLTKVPGVGKKTAERLIIDLQDRVGHLTGAVGGQAASPQQQDALVRDEAEAALVALGYRGKEASTAVAAAWLAGMTTEACLKASLKSLMKGDRRG